MRAFRLMIAIGLCLATNVAEAWAQAIPSRTLTTVNCDGVASSSGIAPVSCSNGASHAAASASFTTLKAEAYSSAHAFAMLQDSAKFSPVDAALLGTRGTAQIKLSFDGSMGSSAANYLELRGYEGDYFSGEYTFASRSLVDFFVDGGAFDHFHIAAPGRGTLKMTVTGGSLFFDGSITFIYDYTFGDDLFYGLQMLAVAPDGAVDFYNTAMITQVQAFDALGSAVNGSFTTASGTILPTATTGVPEPTTWAMMLVGFGAIGFSMRRKQRQMVRYSFG